MALNPSFKVNFSPRTKPEKVKAEKQANKLGNDEGLELQWAVKAYDHAETYFNLICSLDNTRLKLSRRDDFIYQQFRAYFPKMNVSKVTDEEMKNSEAKAKWREFMMIFKHLVEDYNFGMLLRVDATKDISDDNTIFVLKTQFLAIEIARNREGLNQEIRRTTRVKVQKDRENQWKQEQMKSSKSDNLKNYKVVSEAGTS